MNRIFVYLSGGLGNQMFQYAAARSLAVRYESELFLDTWSGFVRDKKYHRQYELDRLPIKAMEAGTVDRLPIWLYRIDTKLRRKSINPLQKKIYGNFFIETAHKYIGPITYDPTDSWTWLIGYWQSPLYFSDHSSFIRNELRPPEPANQEFLRLGNSMRQEESIALGIRLYEESFDPSAHARDGRVKTSAELVSAVKRMKMNSPSAKIYVFCTHRSRLLDDLELPDDTIFVTHDDGYEGTFERLWLLTQCRHHIVTNSSYYWWGAWLSRCNYEGKPQHILAADNFINVDSLCQGWSTF